MAAAQAVAQLVGDVDEVGAGGVDDDVGIEGEHGGSVSRDGDAQRAAEAGDLAQVAPDLGGIAVDGADELGMGLAGDETDDGGADGADAILNDANGTAHDSLLF